MKLKLYSIYDSKLEAYAQIFSMPTKGAAIRAWISTVNDRSTDINKYPADYTLFEIGEFDDQTGNLTCHHAKLNLGTALEVLNNPTQNKIPEVAQ